MQVINNHLSAFVPYCDRGRAERPFFIGTQTISCHIEHAYRRIVSCDSNPYRIGIACDQRIVTRPITCHADYVLNTMGLIPISCVGIINIPVSVGLFYTPQQV